MITSYTIIDDISFADIAFEAKGVSINELFLASSEALLSIMLNNPKSLSGLIIKRFNMYEESYEMLLYEFLSEILFYKDAEKLIVVPKDVSVSGNAPYDLDCIAFCELIDHERHEFNIDIKAITMHHLAVEKKIDGWRAVVVIDV